MSQYFVAKTRSGQEHPGRTEILISSYRKTILNTKLATVIALTFTTFSMGNALAANPVAAAKTRADVLAELVEAQRTGDIMDHVTGKKLYEVYPGQYPTRIAAREHSRAEVQAELIEARRTGELMDHVTGKKLNEVYPGQYPVKH